MYSKLDWEQVYDYLNDVVSKIGEEELVVVAGDLNEHVVQHGTGYEGVTTALVMVPTTLKVWGY